MRLTHCLKCEDDHHVPGLHGWDEDGKQRVTQEELVHSGYLSAASIVLEHTLNTADHVVDILSLLEEAHLLGESKLANNIKSIELEPFAEIDRFVLVDKCGETRHEQLDARINSWLHLEQLPQTVGSSHFLLLFIVILLIERREQVGLRSLLP